MHIAYERQRFAGRIGDASTFLHEGQRQAHLLGEVAAFLSESQVGGDDYSIGYVLFHEIITEYGKGNIEYREAAEAVPSLYASVLKGKQRNDVKAWAKDFMEGYVPEHIFSYSKQLVLQVRNLVDITIAVSGSPIEPIEEIQGLGFDQVYGSFSEIEDGVYTGKVVANLNF